MGRDKIKIYLVDHTLGTREIDQFGKNLDDLVKVLQIKGYQTKAENVPISLSPEFDIIILHPPLHWIRDCYDFHKKYPEIPMIFCPRIYINRYNFDFPYPDKIFKSYINDKDEDGVYSCEHIILKPFLKFIKYLTGKNKKYASKIY